MSKKEFIWHNRRQQYWLTSLPEVPVSREEAVSNYFDIETERTRFGSDYDRQMILVEMIAKLSNLLSPEAFEELVNYSVEENPEYSKNKT